MPDLSCEAYSMPHVLKSMAAAAVTFTASPPHPLVIANCERSRRRPHLNGSSHLAIHLRALCFCFHTNPGTMRKPSTHAESNAPHWPAHAS
eukprot:4378064-Pleurochrysis_carterae.AAC.2